MRAAPSKARRAGPAPATRGFTLISVLVALLVAGFGVLAAARLMATATAATTQNQVVASISWLANAFWGTVQANPAMLVDPAINGTFNSGNTTSAPSALQPWLAQAVGALPSAQISIATSADAATSSGCAVATGCTVTLTMQWNQVAANGMAAKTRSQVMYYQFGGL